MALDALQIANLSPSQIAKSSPLGDGNKRLVARQNENVQS